MSAFSLRILDVPQAGGEVRRVLTAYLHNREIGAQQFSGSLVALLSQQSGFDHICFLGKSDRIDQARRWMASEELIGQRLSQAIGRSADEITTFVSFNANTRRFENPNQPESPGLTDFTNRIRRAALMGMFREADGLVDSPHGTHYVKPSGKHTNQFLRVARVLETELNVSEIAFWLLPLVGHCTAISQILVDTSGILAIAYSLAYECALHTWAPDLPTVRSHNSYDGLPDLTLTDPRSTVCLISASTSGELEKQLVALGIPAQNIVTLYFLGRSARRHESVLCDLSASDDNQNGYQVAESYGKNHCKFCDRKSLPIRISGDQFVLEQPKIREIEITASDLQQRDLIDPLAGTGFFKVFRTTDAGEHEIFLDVEALLSVNAAGQSYDATGRFKTQICQKLQAYMRRGLPVHTRRIVYGSHPHSHSLASEAKHIFGRFQDPSQLAILRALELRGAEPIPESATLVVGSCFDGSHELMTINMLLRNVQPRGNTTYAGLFYRCEGRSERERVRKTVTFGENRAESFNFYTAADLFLPRCLRAHSWRTELQLLEKLQHEAEVTGADLPDEIVDRIAALRAAPRSGLENDLFWPSANGARLTIQYDFVFLETRGRLERISQADIFVVAGAILHGLRQRQDSRQLTCGPYRKSILAPDNFVRFNDPVLHAALLRAARGYELAYANCEEEISQRAKSVIEGQIESARAGKPDSLMEFLLALAVRRMTLDADDLSEICAEVSRATDLPASCRMLAVKLTSEIQRPDAAPTELVATEK